MRDQIFILDGSVAITGAFVSAREMARVLGVECEVILVLPDNSTITETELAVFFEVRRIPIRPLRRRLRDILLYFPYLIVSARKYLIVSARKLIALMPSATKGLLIVNDFYLMQAPVLRLLGFRGRILTWVRVRPDAFGRIGVAWLWFASRTSDGIISVSQHIQELICSTTESKLLYNSISPDYLDEIPRSFSQNREFVFVGNYIPGKGQNVAIAALAKVRQYVPEARIRFHGGDMGLEKNRQYLQTLKSLAKDLGIADAVTFGGFARSPRVTLIGAFAALNLSRSESFSRTVLEASACGLPVIATRSGGPAEIVVDGETGLMIPVDDAEACAAAMRLLCDDPDRAARMGTAGRARVLKTFSPETFAHRLRSLIQETT